MILARTGDRLGDLGLQRRPKGRQVGLAVDAAELLLGLDHPGGDPAQRQVPSCQRLTLAAWSWQMAIIDSRLLCQAAAATRGCASVACRRAWSAHRGG
jgi:hypothetical protein